jgi:hypothetical protein
LSAAKATVQVQETNPAGAYPEQEQVNNQQASSRISIFIVRCALCISHCGKLRTTTAPAQYKYKAQKGAVTVTGKKQDAGVCVWVDMAITISQKPRFWSFFWGGRIVLCG